MTITSAPVFSAANIPTSESSNIIQSLGFAPYLLIAILNPSGSGFGFVISSPVITQSNSFSLLVASNNSNVFFFEAVVTKTILYSLLIHSIILNK